MVLLGVAALVAGCSSDGTDASNPSGAASGAGADIEIIDVDSEQFLADSARYKFQFRSDGELFACITGPVRSGEAVFELNCRLPFAEGAAEVTDPYRQITGPPRLLRLAAEGNHLVPADSSGGPDEATELGVGERLKVGAITCTRLGESALECTAPIGEFRFEEGALWLDGEPVDMARPQEQMRPSDVVVGPGTNCGITNPAGGSQGLVELLEGRVSCADAVEAVEAYDAQRADVGAQPQQVGAWLCSTDTEVLTRYRTTCVKDGVTVARQ